MPVNKSQHYVPQHYLRQFRIEGTKQISTARIEPFHFIDRATISGQCKQDYFYQDDGQLDDLLQQCEHDLAPVLLRVTQQRKFDSKELVALRFLAVILKVRTRKSVELAKVFPRKIAYEVIKSAIERGELPEPQGGWKEGMMDFTGVAGVEFKSTAVLCWLEMQTLGCKLLEAETGSWFVTSDHPVVMMNQLFAALEPHRSFAGFSRSGFQLLLPISPRLCLFFYDPKVYKVGGRRHQLVEASRIDVELVNSLQIQSAEECIYCHRPDLKPEISRLIATHAPFRTPVRASLRELAGRKESESILHLHQPSPKLTRPWTFCRFRKRRNVGENNRRDPSWSAFVSAVVKDMDENPGRDLFGSMEKLLGHPFRESAAEEEP
jgi:hypothetical protein